MSGQKVIGHIDLEPTWEALGHGVERGFFSADVIAPALKLADTVRQAQKRGAKSVTFTFDDTTNAIKVHVEEART